MECTHHYDSPLGGITMAGVGNCLTGLWFDGQTHFEETLSSDNGPADLPVFAETSEWLDVYFSGRDPGTIPDIAPRGTGYRLKVWSILRNIPFGETVTYGEIAGTIGPGSSARAVGGAVGHNPISIIIPCHRVTGANRALTGYAGGTDRKLALLRLEGVDISDQSV